MQQNNSLMYQSVTRQIMGLNKKGLLVQGAKKNKEFPIGVKVYLSIF